MEPVDPFSSHEDIDRAKSVLRMKARAARRSVSPEARAGSALAIAQQVLELGEIRTASAVLVYGASPEEADPAPLEHALRARGVRVAYPRIAGPRELTLHWVDSPEVLVEGDFGLKEPHERAPAVDLDEIGAIVVPGVAFDDAGNRLGFGGGYYDTLLSGPGHVPPTIGIAYDEQVVEHVPHEGRDRPVDVLVTPTRTVRCATSRP